jgi:hypothetical protein
MKKSILTVILVGLGLIGISFQSPIILAEEVRTTTIHMSDPEFAAVVPIPGDYPDFANYGCQWVDSKGPFKVVGCPLVPDGPIGHCCESPCLYFGFWEGDLVLLEFNNHKAADEGFEYHAWVIIPESGLKEIRPDQMDRAVNILRGTELMMELEEQKDKEEL